MEKHSKLKNKKRKKTKQNKTGVVIIDIDNFGDSFAGLVLKNPLKLTSTSFFMIGE